ncbi:hypothetical protein [Empedobacter tilapiae]
MKNILNYICLFFIISCNAGNNKKELNNNKTSLDQEIISKNQQQEKEIWKFYKISENPIFETKKSDLLSINKKFSNTIIVLSENKINITNYCQNIDYVNLRKKSLYYFTNKDNLERYSKELLKDNLKINDSINIIRSTIPSEECEYPFGEIIKLDKFLIVLYEGYLIYYSKENSDDVKDFGSYQFENDNNWNEQEIFKITAYLANTYDFLFKKSENLGNTNRGRISYLGSIFSYSFKNDDEKSWEILKQNFEQDNYYNLPHLKEATSDALEFEAFDY